MEFDVEKLPALESKIAALPAGDPMTEPEPLLPDPISIGNTDPETQRIAIQQNVELLKKKKNHQDRIFDYLETELFGRSKRHGEPDLTKEQEHLLARLRDNADDFDILYGQYDVEESKSDPEFDAEEETCLTAQREVIIQQILQQLALPINTPDEVESSDPPAPEPFVSCDAPQHIENTTKSNEPETSNEAYEPTAQPTQDEFKIIEEFADLIGATRQQCEEFLYAANWDLKLALSNFYENQSKGKQPVSTLISRKEALDALNTFMSFTNTDSATAGGYLFRAKWDVDKAVSIFFDEAEASRNRSECVDQSTSTKPIQDKPVKHMAVGTDDATKRRALGTHESSAKLIADAMKESKDVTKAATPRKARSHSGLIISLDAAGNVLSFTQSWDTPYQQYLKMRRRLQIQHYGHEAIPSSDDPHRGIPTRERCPPPFVQEAVSEFDEDISTSSTETEPPACLYSDEKMTEQQKAEAEAEAEAEAIEMAAVMAIADAADAAEAEAIVNLADASEGWFSFGTKSIVQDIVMNSPPLFMEIDSDDDMEDVANVDFLPGSDDDDGGNVQGASKMVTASLKDAPSTTTKLTMKVRFNLGDKEATSTNQHDSISPSESTSHQSTTTAPKASQKSEYPAKTVRFQLVDLPSAGDMSSSVQNDTTNSPPLDAEKEEKQAHADDEKNAERKRALFVSDQKDAWDGLDSDGDEGDGLAESDGDAEEEMEEEEEEEEEQQQRGEVDEEKEEYRERVDEVMQD
jgi:hypothetical protein